MCLHSALLYASPAPGWGYFNNTKNRRKYTDFSSSVSTLSNSSLLASDTARTSDMALAELSVTEPGAVRTRD